MLHTNKFVDFEPAESDSNAQAPEESKSGRCGMPGLTTMEVTDDLHSLEQEWRAFERHADCTPFQSFDWLSTWQDCIGTLACVKPAIITGRGVDGGIMFLLPLAIEKFGPLRRLVFLGHEFCDYNAPLLAADLQKTIRASQCIGELQRACTTLLRANYRALRIIPTSDLFLAGHGVANQIL